MIIAVCVLLAMILDRIVIQWLSTYTIKAGIAIIRFFARFCCCCCCSEAAKSSRDGKGDDGSESTLQQVQNLIKGLTGGNQLVDGTTSLRDIGLDSLGATALLGTLRASLPSARVLTLRQLEACETVNELVAILSVKTDNEEVPAVINESYEETEGESSDV